VLDVKPLLRQLNLRPSKGRGQSFLVDEAVVEAILQAADLSPRDTVLEVGPGLGILTGALASRVASVVAVEIDPVLVAHLAKSLAVFHNVRILQGDILRLRLAGPASRTDMASQDSPAPPASEALAGNTPPARVRDRPEDLSIAEGYRLVANIPYAITSAILRLFLESAAPPSRMVLMVQKEVAERIVALPGEMSILAVSVQVYGDARLVATVPARSFYPVPRVDSAILRVDLLPRPRVDVDTSRFFRMVSAGFSQKRKQLRNSLAGGLGIEPSEAASLLLRCGIDPQRRAETLSLEEWGRLTQTA
jgi:16S rRNA (adenine1518-N6/adenine1519-N6)-dimethyltransferase